MSSSKSSSFTLELIIGLAAIAAYGVAVYKYVDRLSYDPLPSDYYYNQVDTASAQDYSDPKGNTESYTEPNSQQDNYSNSGNTNQQTVYNFSGTWVNDYGGIVISQSGNTCNVSEFNAYGTTTGSGSGQIYGDELSASMYNAVVNTNYTMTIYLSSDGYSLSGSIFVAGVGSSPVSFVKSYQ